MRVRAVFWWMLVLTLAAAGVAWQWQMLALQPQWNPWAPLDVAAKPGWLTRFKLSRLDADPAACRALLVSTDLRHTVLPDQQTGPSCGFTDAVRVEALPAQVGEPFALSCRTAVSVALWERHALQPAARRFFGRDVEGVEHYGSYACRNVYGRPAATRSRHATAEAWDVAGFVLEGGQRIRVARDWNGDQAAAAFLRAVRDGACRFFDGVLGPDYNAAHHDHFHMDRGPYRICS